MSEVVGTELLNHWAERLIAKVDTLLPRGSAHRETIFELAHLGLCAASEPRLRWRLHLRFAAALDADRVRRNFDSFVQREFPSASWEDFCKQRQSLLDVLACRAIQASNGNLHSNGAASDRASLAALVRKAKQCCDNRERFTSYSGLLGYREVA
jgi:hypothetical protein